MTKSKDWLSKIEKQVNVYEPYRKRAYTVLKKYKDDAESYDNSVKFQSTYNLLYSITETLRPVLYNRTPRPEVRATDKSDKLSRAAAQMLEEILQNTCNNYDFDKVIKDSVLDYLLSGTGTSRVVYSPVFREEELIDVDGEVAKEDVKVYDDVYIDYVSWDNVIIGDARRWEDVPWIAIRSLLTKSQIKDLFGSKISDQLNYTAKYDIDSLSTDSFNRGESSELTEIFEIWDKENKKRIFLTKMHNSDGAFIIEEDDDPLQLTGFFPIPRPLFANYTNNTLIPTPFFIYYQDLQDELEEVTERIKRLVREVKRRGIYDSRIEQIEDVINAGDNEFVPVANFARFLNEAKSIDGVYFELDIAKIIPVIQSLYEQREQIRFAIFEIMGIADIQRGVVDPRETATASRMKGNFGSLRVSEMQREVQRYVRDLYRMKAEIISELFSEQTIALVVNKPIEQVAQVMPLLRAQEPRMVRIDIETDSTIQSNEEGEQEQALQFTNVMNQLSQISPILAQTYGLDFTLELTKSVARKFKMSRGLEDIIDQRGEELKQQQSQPQEEQPNLEMIKAMNEQAKLQLQAQKAQADNQIKIAELQLREQELIVKAQEANAKIELEETKQSIEMAKIAVEQDKIELEAVNPGVNEVVGV